LSLDQDRRELARKEGQLADIQKKISSAQAKLSSATKKATDAEKQASRTKSESTRRTKLRTVQSARDDAAKRQKEIASLEGKVSTLKKTIQGLKEKISREEKNQRRKEQNEAKRREREVDSTIASMDSAIESHEERITALESVPEKITVLYLGTSPKDEAKLRVDEEAREIRQAIRLSANPDAIDLEDRWAIRQNDILQALNETNPTIVHFSGHGAPDGSLVIEDPMGHSQLVPKFAMAAAIGAASEQAMLVVFNACFSDEDYEEVLEHVDAVIGMTTSIGDKAAVAFASQLYSSLGFGLSLKDAFAQARASVAIAAPGEINTPALHVRNGLDPADMVLVAPKVQAEE
jgi:TolA-binding protein